MRTQKEDKGRQGETRPREGGHTIQQFNKRKQAGRQEQRQAFETADTPSNKRKQEGRQGETRPPGRRTHQSTKGNKKEYNGRQRETRPSGSGHTIAQREQEENPEQHTVCRTRRGTIGDKGRQDPAEGGLTIQQRETRRGTVGDKTRPREGRHTIQQGANKKGYNGRQRVTRPLGRRLHHPVGDKTREKADTPSNKGKQERVQWETKGDKTIRKAGTPSNKGKQEGAQWETKGDKTPGKAETPSNKRQQEGVQWETRGDKTLGKADTPCNKGKQEGAQWETRRSGRGTHHPTPRRTP